MKSSVKSLIGCGGVIIFFVAGIIIYSLIVYFNSDNWIARSPGRICKEVGFKLPPYTILDEENNLGRDSSSWSWYYWRIRLKKPLSEKDIHRLENLVKEDPNWDGSRYDIFEYRNYKEYGEKGYDRDYNTFLSPQVNIVIRSYTEVSIKYTWYDSFF